MKLTKEEIEAEILSCESVIKQCEHGIIVNTVVKEAFQKKLTE